MNHDQSDHLLVVDDLTKRFRRRGREFDAVSHVDLVMDEGDFVAIVGRSGNGKSTLITMIAGLTRPTSGVVRVDGCDIGAMDDATLSRTRNRVIGFVMQSQTCCPISPCSIMWCCPPPCLPIRGGGSPSIPPLAPLSPMGRSRAGKVGKASSSTR